MHGWWLVSYVLLWLVVAALGWLAISLSRLVGQIHQRVGPAGALVPQNGPDVGEAILEMKGVAEALSHRMLQFPRERDLLMVFVSPNCPACGDLSRSLVSFARRMREQLDVVAIRTTRGGMDDDALAPYFERVGLPYVALPKLARALSVHGTPFALWLDPSGVIQARGVANTTEHLESLRNARESGFASLERYLEAEHPSAEMIKAP